jgi:integrase
MSKKPRIGRIFQRGTTWWIGYSINGVEKRESSKSDKQTVAEHLLKQRNAEIIAGHFHTAPPALVNELLDDLLHDYEVNGKSDEWVKLVNNVHLRPFFGHLRADQITTNTLNKYIAKRRKQGRKNATINRELSLLRRACNLGLRADPPKVTSVPRIQKLAENNIRKGFFEHAEYQRLLDALPEHLRPVLTFAYYTGCRRNEILSLQWKQIDLTNKMVRLEPGTTKNKDARLIPLTRDLAATLQTLHQQRELSCPWVFPYHGQRIHTFTTAWNNACTAAGLVDENGRHNKIFHDLRRTGVRNLVRAGVPELVAMRISGHRTRSVFDRYNIVNEEDLQMAAAQLHTYLDRHKQPSK